MIRLKCPDNRSLNPAWVEEITCLNDEVRIKMTGRKDHFKVPSSSQSKAHAHSLYLELLVKTCGHSPSGEALIYLKSFDNFPVNLLKIESIACPENDCCVLIKFVDEEIEFRFPFDNKSEALRIAKDIESQVDFCNSNEMWFQVDDSTGWDAWL